MATFSVRSSGFPKSPSSAQKLMWGCAVPLLALIGGGIFMAVGIVPMIIAFNAANWPQTEGIVVESDVGRGDVTTPHRPGNPTSGSTSRTQFRPNVVYTYAVDGVEYTNDRRSAGDHLFETAAEAYRIAGRYRPGTQVTVFYNPRDPQRALLEPRYNRIAWLFASCGVPFVLFGLGMAAMFRSHCRREARVSGQSGI